MNALKCHRAEPHKPASAFLSDLPDMTAHPHDQFEYGCPDCDWWDGGTVDDFNQVCPSCGQRKTFWNMTHAEAENDPETQFEESCHEILHS